MRYSPTSAFKPNRATTRGAAAIEFAGAAMMLVTGVLNAVDIGDYIIKRMAVENAAQAGAQAAWNACYDQSTMLPATKNCPALVAAVTAAVQSTSLGGAVSLSTGYPAEGYYCATASGLQLVGDIAHNPGDCAAAGSATVSPGDYVQVQVSYTYAPLFGLSVMGASGIDSITMTSWMRLG